VHVKAKLMRKINECRKYSGARLSPNHDKLIFKYPRAAA
jgi:hypothetical protein